MTHFSAIRTTRRVMLATALILPSLSFTAHAQGGACKDPWINQAYNQLYHRAPSGSGATGECNIMNYGGGHWTTYQDLVNKVQAYRGAPAAAPVASRPATPAMVAVSYHIDNNLNVVDARNVIIARAGTYNLVNTNGSNIVAQGGGNIVAQGGGNIVAQGGGNMRSLQSVDSRPTFVVR